MILTDPLIFGNSWLPQSRVKEAKECISTGLRSDGDGPGSLSSSESIAAAVDDRSTSV